MSLRKLTSPLLVDGTSQPCRVLKLEHIMLSRTQPLDYRYSVLTVPESEKVVQLKVTAILIFSDSKNWGVRRRPQERRIGRPLRRDRFTLRIRRHNPPRNGDPQSISNSIQTKWVIRATSTQAERLFRGGSFSLQVVTSIASDPTLGTPIQRGRRLQTREDVFRHVAPS
jgi:hypothetical protein